jgi:hypothetical protein
MICLQSLANLRILYALSGELPLSPESEATKHNIEHTTSPNAVASLGDIPSLRPLLSHLLDM